MMSQSPHKWLRVLASGIAGVLLVGTAWYLLLQQDSLTGDRQQVMPAAAGSQQAQSGPAPLASVQSPAEPATRSSQPSAQITASSTVALPKESSAVDPASPTPFARLPTPSGEQGHDRELQRRWLDHPPGDPRTAVDEDARIHSVTQRRREVLLERPGFKYPLIRRIEMVGTRAGEEYHHTIAEMVADHLAVRLHRGADINAVLQDLNHEGLHLRYRSPHSGTYLLAFCSDDMDRFRRVEGALREHPQVRLVSSDDIIHPLAEPDDPEFPVLWGLHNTGQEGFADDTPPATPGADINARRAWQITTGSPAVIVAVIDGGVDYTHEDLAPNMWVNPDTEAADVYGYDFYDDDPDPMDPAGHGTHVAGTIAAVGNNGIGVTGVSWQAQIMALRFLGPQGGTAAAAADAMHYAVDNGARIVNNSWGGPTFNSLIRDAVEYANERNVLMIMAAGNENNNNDTSPRYPASYDFPNVIAVAASDRNDNRASFSNYGLESVHLAAPGFEIVSTFPGNQYRQGDGTSMAAPHVSGVAALLMAHMGQDVAIDRIRRAILENVQPIDTLSQVVSTGGRLDAFASLSAIVQQPFDGHARLSFDDEYAGDGDGYINPGETIHATLHVSNYSLGPVDGLTAEITVIDGDDYLTLDDATFTIPELSPGGHYDFDGAFHFTIASDIEVTPQTVLLELSITDGEEHWTREVSFVIRDVFTLEGVVLLDNQPFPQDTVRVAYRGTSVGWVPVQEDGRYSISLPQGAYEIHAALKEYHPEEWLGDWTYRSPWEVVNGLEAESLTHNILWSTGRVYGRVTGFPEVGVADVEIKTEWEFPWIGIYYEPGRINTRFRYHMTATDADGYFELPMIIPDNAQALLRFASFAHPLYELDPGATIGGTWPVRPDLELNHTLRSIGIEARPKDLTIIVAPDTVTHARAAFYNTGNQASRYYFTDTMPYYSWEEIAYNWLELNEGLGQAVDEWDYDESIYDDEGVFATSTGERKQHTIPLGFAMPYYGSSVTQAHVHADGWLSFRAVEPSFKAGSMLTHGVPFAIDGLERADVVAPLWIHWIVDENRYLEGLYYHHIDDETLIIQWDRRIGSNRFSYQVWLFADGRIHFSYRRPPQPNSGGGFLGYAGISDRWCLRGITIDQNNASNGSWSTIANSTTIAFTPHHPWLTEVPHRQLFQADDWEELQIRIDSTGLPVGDYHASIYAMLPDNRYISQSGIPWEPDEELRITLKVRDLEGPEADAGSDQILRLGEAITLDGSASTGPQLPLTYTWEQIDGPQSLPLQGSDTARPVIALAPDGLESPGHFGSYTFRLTVSDGEHQATDTVRVNVEGMNVALHKPVVASSPTRYTSRPNWPSSDQWWTVPDLQAITDGWKTKFSVSFWAGDLDPNRGNRIWFEIDLEGTFYINQVRIDYLFLTNPRHDRWLEYQGTDGSWRRMIDKYNRMGSVSGGSGWMGIFTDYPPVRNGSVVATAVRMLHDTNQPDDTLLISSLELYGMRLSEYDTEPNNPPVAHDAHFTVDQEHAVDIVLSASDADGDPLIYAIAAQPRNGRLHGQPPNILYRPNSAFYGEDSFTFTAHDGKAVSNIATISIDVHPVHHPPIAVADRAWVRPGETARVEVLLNDRHRDQRPLHVVSVEGASHGSVSHDGRVVRYTPDEGWNGLDTFLYTIADDRGAEASAQIQIYTGDPLLAHLPLLDNADDITVYEHHGILDGSSLAGDGGLTDAGTLWVEADNQALSLASNGALSDHPIRRRSVAFWLRLDRLAISGREQVLYQEGDARDSASAPFLQLVVDRSGRLRAQVSDPGWDEDLRHPALEYGLVSEGWQHVAVVFDGENPDTLGSLDIYIDGERLDRVTVGNVLGARNGAVVFANDAQRNQAALGRFNDLRIYDWALTSAEVAALARNPGGDIENHPPTAEDLHITVERNHSVTFTLPGSDPDPADILIYDILDGPSRGHLVVTGDRATYIPDPDYVGEDAFTYLVSDGRAESSPATVSITVLGSILRRISMDHIRGMWFWEHRDDAGTSQDSAGQSVISDLNPDEDHVLQPVPGEPQ